MEAKVEAEAKAEAKAEAGAFGSKKINQRFRKTQAQLFFRGECFFEKKSTDLVAPILNRREKKLNLGFRDPSTLSPRGALVKF